MRFVLNTEKEREALQMLTRLKCRITEEAIPLNRVAKIIYADSKRSIERSIESDFVVGECCSHRFEKATISELKDLRTVVSSSMYKELKKGERRICPVSRRPFQEVRVVRDWLPTEAVNMAKDFLKAIEENNVLFVKDWIDKGGPTDLMLPSSFFPPESDLVRVSTSISSFFVAYEKGNIDIISMLLKQGNIKIVHTPTKLCGQIISAPPNLALAAFKKGRTDIMEVLLKYGVGRDAAISEIEAYKSYVSTCHQSGSSVQRLAPLVRLSSRDHLGGGAMVFPDEETDDVQELPLFRLSK